MDKYWQEQEAQCRDGGHLTHDDSMALFDYLRDLTMTAHWLINEPYVMQRWFNLKTVLDGDPKEPE